MEIPYLDEPLLHSDFNLECIQGNNCYFKPRYYSVVEVKKDYRTLVKRYVGQEEILVKIIDEFVGMVGKKMKNQAIRRRDLSSDISFNNVYQRM